MRRLRHLATLALLVSSMLTMLAFASMASPEHPEETESGHATAEPVDAEHAPDGSVQHDEGGASGDGHEEVAADDDNQWLGLEGAMVAGVLLGLLAFTMSGVAGLGAEDHH